jgi:hypothetical protein
LTTQGETTMQKLSATITVLLLAGCASQADIAQLAPANERMKLAHKNARIDCANKRDCDKAFDLAKVYVQSNADMNVQFSDSTLIATSNTPNRGIRDDRYDQLVELKATKTPESGDSATIDLFAFCNGLEFYFDYRHTDAFVGCANKLTAIYDGFRPFIESRLK